MGMRKHKYLETDTGR